MATKQLEMDLGKDVRLQIRYRKEYKVLEVMLNEAMIFEHPINLEAEDTLSLNIETINHILVNVNVDLPIYH